MRQPKSSEVEKLLYDWITTLNNKVQISDEIIREKAIEYGNHLGLKRIKFSSGWINGFKLRHGLKLRKLHGEDNSSDFIGATDAIRIIIQTLF